MFAFGITYSGQLFRYTLNTCPAGFTSTNFLLLIDVGAQVNTSAYSLKIEGGLIFSLLILSGFWFDTYKALV
jgi:hypothetical protein